MKVKLASDLSHRLEKSHRVMLAVGPYVLRAVLIFAGLMMCVKYFIQAW